MITTAIRFFWQIIWHTLQHSRVILALRTPCLVTLVFLFVCLCIAVLMGALYLFLSQIQ